MLVFIATWVLAAFLPVLDQAHTGHLDEEAAYTAPGTVAGLSRLDSVDELRGVPGVRAVAPMLLVEPTQTDEEDWTGRGTIGDCAAIAPMLREPLSQCAAGIAIPIGLEPTHEPIRVIDLLSRRTIEVGPGSFDCAADTLDDNTITAALHHLGLGDYLLPPSNTPANLPADWPVQMLVATDGSPDTVEAVKSVMAASVGIVPSSFEDQKRADSTEQDSATLLLVAYLAAIALIALVSLAVVAVDDLRNRARWLASLAATGTPTPCAGPASSSSLSP